uniref:Molybdenum cofactor synthesis 2 n=1 Tax=Cyprinus carpio TaxID=7962 RepID=A0A8C2AY98_CYPCA
MFNHYRDIRASSKCQKDWLRLSSSPTSPKLAKQIFKYADLNLITLTTDKLSADRVSESVTCPSCGALFLFIGTTRDNFEGKKVIRYKVCFVFFPTVPITEASVIIGISSPHRRDSLEAVKYCIDTLKATVPVWKKEIYESGELCWKQNKECLWADAGKQS